MNRLALIFLLAGSLACGSDDPNTEATLPTGRDLPCRASTCGSDAARSAVPSRALLRIDFDAVNRSKDASGLEDYSSFYDETLTHITQINTVIDATFDELEFAAGAEPVVEGEDHLWRTLAGETDIVLDIDSADGQRFDIAFFEGAPGFTPDAPIVRGFVQLAGETLEALELTIDVGALALVEDLEGEGQIFLAARVRDGLPEVVFDTRGLSIDGTSVGDSESTYWTFGDDDHALAFFEDVEDESYSVYVRWNEGGGRWDSHSATDDEAGIVDRILTACWDRGAREVFAAEADLNEALEFDGQLAGEEEDCLFGPVADDPRGGAGFENLPGEGEWQAIDFIGCNPETQSCPNDCENDDQCEGSLICERGECVPSGCENDDQCDGSLICERGECVPSGCENDDQCDGSLICERGECIPECDFDEDCDFDFICEAQVCVAE